MCLMPDQEPVSPVRTLFFLLHHLCFCKIMLFAMKLHLHQATPVIIISTWHTLFWILSSKVLCGVFLWKLKVTFTFYALHSSLGTLCCCFFYVPYLHPASRCGPVRNPVSSALQCPAYLQISLQSRKHLSDLCKSVGRTLQSANKAGH